MIDQLVPWIALAVVFVALAVLYLPFGGYMAKVYESEKHTRFERLFYKVTRVNGDGRQNWMQYARSVFIFSMLSLVFLYILQRIQQWLPLAYGVGPVAPDQAWNTAVSFVTNTNWQSYSGEQTMSQLTQIAGLAVQNFVSAAVGMSVAVALFRGIANRQRDGLIGNFWVDLTRTVFRIFLPVAVVGAVLLISQGVIQNFSAPQTVSTFTGGTQTIPGGPVASQEVIKELGTNGGGFFNVNSMHPFENPTVWSNMLEIFLILFIPVSLTRTYGLMVKDKRQGWAVLATMAVLYFINLALVIAAELHVPLTGGAGMEGKEMRFGVIPSAFFAVTTTMTSTGAVDSAHSSYSPLGGAVLLVDMMLGEISPGGVGAGMYGMLIVVIMSVFICGLMVGRTPEYMGKRIRAREIKLVSFYILTMPALVLLGVGISTLLPSTRDSLANEGPHGLSEIVYAFTSASNNNGSAFAGLDANTYWFNIALGTAMLLGRFIPILMTLALAGSFATQSSVAETEGTLPTHRPQFVIITVGIALIIGALTFLPTLVLGPILEALL